MSNKEKRQKELKKLLIENKYSRSELAKILDCSEKTIMRYIKVLEDLGNKIRIDRAGKFHIETTGLELESEVSVSAQQGGRLLFLLHKISLNSKVSFKTIEQLVNELDEDDRCCEKTLKKDLAFLVAKGWIKEEDSYYYPGDFFMPRFDLSQEELLFLVKLLQEYGHMSPYKPEVSSVLGKLLATCPRRELIMDNHDVNKRLKRILYHGKKFCDNIKISKVREKLDEAIATRRRVRIAYQNHSGKQTIQTLSPIKLCYNRNNDCWYLFTLPLSKKGQPQMRRLDLIQGINLLDSQYTMPDGLSQEDLENPDWSIADSKTVNVKIRFSNIFNIQEKVRLQMADRPKKTIWEDESGDYFYYEDEVRGISEFTSWLRRFGRAAEVLEPKWLRQEFLRTAIKLLQQYNEPLPQKNNLVKEQ